MRKSHTIIQSLNIVPIDKPKSSIDPNFGNPLEEEENDIEENDIEEDDFEEDINFCSGKSHSISNVKHRVNNFVKQIDEIPY